MNLTVEWVMPERLLLASHTGYDLNAMRKAGRIPVIRVATLRAWLEHSADGCITIENLLAQLPEE